MDETDNIKELREKIDAIDDQVLELLNKRAEIVLKVRYIKTKKGVPRLDPDRERELKDRLMAANKGPLPDDAIKRIYENILRHMRMFSKVNQDTD